MNEPNLQEAQQHLEERRRSTLITTSDAGPDSRIDTAKDSLQPSLDRLANLAKSLTPEQQVENKKRYDDRIAAMKLESARAKFAKSHSPARHCAITTIDRTGEWAETETKLQSRIGSGFLIVLIGIRGCGKTQLAVEIMRHATTQHKTVLYCSAMEFFIRVKSSYRKDSQETEESIISRFSSPDLLVIDEIGQRADNDWENRLLYELLNRRYNSGKDDTLLVSNQDLSAVQASLGPSIISRMQETGGIIECNWSSYRV